MKYFSITAITKSPLSIRSDHASSGAEMTQCIPGTSLLGSLASTYKLLYPEDIHTFERLFLSGDVSFPYLYLSSYKKDEELPKFLLDLPIFPTPKTALTCKRHKGFRYPQSPDNDGHGVRDTLIARAIFNEWPETEKVSALAVLDAIKQCPSIQPDHGICGEPTDRYDGYYRRLNEKEFLSSESQKHLQTHTGINRFSGTVQEGILFNRHVFDEETSFWGLVKISDESLVPHLEAFFSAFEKKGIMRLGTGKTRGMGKVQLSLEEQDEQEYNFSSFQQRLDRFNTLFQNEANKYPPLHAQTSNNYYFAVTLHSPTILNDEMLRYRGTISAETLKTMLVAPPNGIQQVYQQAHLQRITGWQELWGTPRANEYALEAGSVFLFKCPLSQREKVLLALYPLEEQGIGKKQREGFGRIRISDEFHQEVSWL